MKDKYNLSQEQNIFLANKKLATNIYNSAKLEGLNVTFSETKTILDGINVSNVRLDEITCILNLRDAWKEILKTLKEPLTLDYICKINSLVSRNESLEWGVLRTGQIGITGVDYIPDIPDEEKVKIELEKIKKIENKTLQAIKYFLFGSRNQLFWDGNKRTSMFIANKIMIEAGKGIITVKEDNLLEFNKLLTEFYNTREEEKLIKFIYDNCIFGIEEN